MKQHNDAKLCLTFYLNLKTSNSVRQVIFLLIKPVTKINRPENAFIPYSLLRKCLQKVFQSCIFPYSQGREDPSKSYRVGLRGLSGQCTALHQRS